MVFDLLLSTNWCLFRGRERKTLGGISEEANWTKKMPIRKPVRESVPCSTVNGPILRDSAILWLRYPTIPPYRAILFKGG